MNENLASETSKSHYVILRNISCDLKRKQVSWNE